MTTDPYISVVVVGRNDNYGVNFLDRINNFIRSLDYQVKNYPNLLELIIVEWNPRPQDAPIKDVIAKVDNLNIRVITVSPELHNKLEHPLPVLEFHGKNVGARRAQGEFVLVTNPDILFTDEMITEFSKRRLSEECFYRTDRYDFVSDEINTVEPKDYTEFAIERTFQGHLMFGPQSWTPEFQNPGSIWVLPRSGVTGETIHTNGSGDFLLVSRTALERACGFFENPKRGFHNDSFSTIRLLHHGLHQVVFTVPLCIFHQHHERGERDPWDPQDAFRQGKTTGAPDWGLGNAQLEEWTNKG